MKNRAIVICCILLVIVLAAGYYSAQSGLLDRFGISFSETANKAGAKPIARPPALVVVDRIRKQIMAPTQILIGRVQPYRLSAVGSAASGRIKDLLVDKGDAVKAGQIIAQLQTATIAAERDVAAAMRKARLAEWKKLTESVDDEIAAAKAKYDKSKFLEEFLTAKKLRIFSAVEAYSKDDREEITTSQRQARAVREESEAVWKQLKNTKTPRINEAKAKLEAAAAEQLRLDEQLKRYSVKAPFDGFVVKKHAEKGEWALQGGLIATIAEMHHVKIEVPVLEDYISYLRIGQVVDVEIPALPPGERKFKGAISFIVPSADPKSHTFPVEIRVENRIETAVDATGKTMKSPLLKVEMLARVQAPAGPTRDNALVVPRDAVKVEGERRTILVVDRDANSKELGTARAVAVQLGAAVGDIVEVIGQVKTGELVVIEGNERLRPGQRVKIKKKS